MSPRIASATLLVALLAAAPAQEAVPRPLSARLAADGIRVEFDDVLHSRIVSTLDGRDNAAGRFSASETVSSAGAEVRDFVFVERREEDVSDTIGKGRRLLVSGRAGALGKTVTVTAYEGFPGVAVYAVRYTNHGERPVPIETWTNNSYVLSATTPAGRPAFWSYQAGSYESRPDWVLPLAPGFAQDNFQGMNATDYGGGTPVVDVWRRDVGLAVGHLERTPRPVSLPVTMPTTSQATLAVRQRADVRLAPGQSFDTLRTS